MPKIQIDITPCNAVVSLLSLLLDDYGELKTDIAEEIASMARLCRKKRDGKTLASTSHRLDDIDITVHSKAQTDS